MINRKTSSIVALLLLAGGFLTVSTILPLRATGAMLYVGGSGPGNYTTIQAAVDAANPGDTVFVYIGTYNESLLINKSISLVGEDRDATVIDGGSLGNVIYVDTTGGVNVTGFTVTNSNKTRSHWAGIVLQQAQDCIIFNNRIIGNENGISLVYSNHTTVVDNNVSANANGINVDTSSNDTIEGNILENEFLGISLFNSHDNKLSNNTAFGGIGGIYLQDSEHNTIANNTAFSNSGNGIFGYETVWITIVNNTVMNSGDTGIRLTHSKNGTIAGNVVSGSYAGIGLSVSEGFTVAGNTMVNNGFDLIGYSMEDWNTHEIDTSNRVNGKPVYYWKDVVGGIVPAGAGQVILANTTGVVVEHQSIDNATTGISLGFSWDNTIANNTVSSNRIIGISLYNSTFNNVADNSVSGNKYGVYLLSWSFMGNNTIEGNTASSNTCGISLFASGNNTLVSNNASFNTECGIGLSYSQNNRVTANVVSSNADYGILLSNSSNNVVFRNRILGNIHQAFDDGNNSWDNGYPAGGNYWSGYTGADQFLGPNQDQPGNDGIGDTPYGIPGGTNRDRYPLLYIAAPPSAPRNLVAVGGNGVVTLTWDSPIDNGGSPITNYTIWRGTAPGSETLLTTIDATTSFMDTGLTNGQTYYYRVNARNVMGEGQNSTEVNATPATTPSEPLNLHISYVWNTSAGNGSIVLTWSPPTTDGGSPITNYRIYRGTEPGNETLLVIVGNVLNHNDTTAAPLQKYYYRVSAVNAIGEGPNSTEVTAELHPRSPPPAPKSILEEPLFWALVAMAIISLVAGAFFIMRRRRGEKQEADKPQEDSQEIVEK